MTNIAVENPLFFMEKSTQFMAIFHSYVTNYQRVRLQIQPRGCKVRSSWDGLYIDDVFQSKFQDDFREQTWPCHRAQASVLGVRDLVFSSTLGVAEGFFSRPNVIRESYDLV